MCQKSLYLYLNRLESCGQEQNRDNSQSRASFELSKKGITSRLWTFKMKRQHKYYFFPRIYLVRDQLPRAKTSPSTNANKSRTGPSQYRKHLETGLESKELRDSNLTVLLMVIMCIAGLL